MDDKLRQSIEPAGWQVWDAIGGKSGGGQCFFCFRANGVDALADALGQMTAPTWLGCGRELSSRRADASDLRAHQSRERLIFRVSR
jgi:hypothetical protein